MILARTAQQQRRSGGRLGLLPQSPNGRLAMIAQQLDGLVEQFRFVFRPRRGVSPP